jgi:hypothetical protein
MVVAMIEAETAIVLLGEQLQKPIERLAYDDPEVYRWYSVTERIVEEAFGKGHRNYSHFVCTVTYGETRQERQECFEDRIRGKKALLMAFIDQLKLFPGREPKPPEPAAIRRQLLSEIAERAIASPTSPFISYKDLPTAKRWTNDAILDHLEILQEESRVELRRLGGSDECMVKLTGRGRMSLETDEYQWQRNQQHVVREQAVVNTNTVTFNNSPVIGNVSQVAGGQRSDVRQSTRNADLEKLFRSVDAVVEQVKSCSTLPVEMKRDAEIEGNQLKSELQKSAPNTNRLKEILSWFGTLNGVVQFGAHLPTLVRDVTHWIQHLS